MLKNTFIHIPGIGPKIEQRLWEAGFYTWEDVLENMADIPLAPKWSALLQRHIETSIKALSERNAFYFSSCLPSSQHWRLFPEFRNETVYLDIETTGLNKTFSDITVIGLYDGKKIFHYTMGENLHTFEEAIFQYKVVVTFNGRCFDVPFIERFFRIQLHHGHIDLRFVLKSLGFRGGLKRCEESIGIDRGNLKEVDGFMAVLLWRAYMQTGDSRVLETLLAYNTQDIVNLETLLVHAYNLKLRETPFLESRSLPLPWPPLIPFTADPMVIERIAGEGPIKSW